MADAKTINGYNLKDAAAREAIANLDTVKLASSGGASGSIRFGVDGEGNYGYYKAGADTVTPFKKDGDSYSRFFMKFKARAGWSHNEWEITIYDRKTANAQITAYWTGTYNLTREGILLGRVTVSDGNWYFTPSIPCYLNNISLITQLSGSMTDYSTIQYAVADV